MASIIVGCGNTKPISEDTTVYISGTYDNQACYWTIKDGIPNRVTLKNIGTSASNAYSIFVEQKNVYIGGRTASGIPCYWKNNEIPIALSNKTGIVKSIFVNNGVVYSAGSCYECQNDCYWKNNSSPIEIAKASGATSIFVSKDNIYVAGKCYEQGVWSGTCYWVIKDDKVKERVALYDGSTSSGADVWSIFVYKDVVYTAGSYRKNGDYEPCYWVGDKFNSLIHPLLPGKDWSANSIYVDKDENVYIAGGEYGKPYYWKTSKATPELLSSAASAMAKSIFVFNGKIYVAGIIREEGNVPCCWIVDKEGKVNEILLEKAAKGTCEVTGVCVAE